ncbi:MAG: hypothetical protein MUC29_07965 [Pyrinomonadaceae bacterium]|jgi:hypothetical protein|nr:hypothetical protein [Pyrinomonadaceae bacterium]
MNKYQRYAILVCRSLSILIIVYGIYKSYFGSQITIDFADSSVVSFILSKLIDLFISLIPGFVFIFLSQKIGMWIGKNLED